MQDSRQLFPLKPQHLPHHIKITQQQSSCLVFIRQKANIKQPLQQLLQQQYQYLLQQSIEIEYRNRNVELVIKGQYVLERDVITKEISSGFKCDFEVKFWLIRSQSRTPNNVGKLLGIAFQFPTHQHPPQPQKISLFLPEQDIYQSTIPLQHFSSVLQKKYIVQKQFHQKYKAIKRIGKGVTACVYSSLCLVDKSQVAIKSFKREVYFALENGNGKKGFLKEFKILTQLNSKYLSKLLGVYESQFSIYIVQELLDRTLYNYLQRFGYPQTQQTRRILYQLLIGLKFLHKKNIMHRDIKLQNIMMRGAGKDNVEPVIVDYGLADYTWEKQCVYIRCGTPGYVAPQVINSSLDHNSSISYDKSCDIFSLGVIFHIMLLGKNVFQSGDWRVVMQKNRLCQIDYQFRNYPSMALQTKDLLRGMLQRQPKKRYTVEELMEHLFFIQEKEHFSAQVLRMERDWRQGEKESEQINKKDSEESKMMKEEKEEQRYVK